jgi:hypothetical protein
MPANQTAGDGFRSVAAGPAAIGSLAAAATWLAASRASAGPIFSTTISNTPLTSGAGLDIDGNSTDDYTIFFSFQNGQNLNLSGLSTGLGNNASARSNVQTPDFRYYTQAVTSGSTVDGTLNYLASTTLGLSGNANAPANLGSFSTGLRFTGSDAQLHYGWITFSFPNNTTPWTGAVAVSAGWETTPNTPIVVGVPEPSAALLGGVAIASCLVGRWLKFHARRR